MLMRDAEKVTNFCDIPIACRKQQGIPQKTNRVFQDALNFELGDFIGEGVYTLFILLCNFVDFLHGVADLHRA